MRAEILHPARLYSFDDLMAGLQQSMADGLINEAASGDLRLYCYTKRCSFERRWNPFTEIARGLVLNVAQRRIIGLPFPKFWNLGEFDRPVPSGPFECFEKVDGSLIVIFHDGQRWRAATKGSFVSPQAEWAQAILDNLGAVEEAALDVGDTYLAEAVYPENKIVVTYRERGLVLLGGYDADGYEMERHHLEHISGRVGWRCSRSVTYASFDELVQVTRGLPASEEGHVVRWGDGTRLKVKGDEYCRLHSISDRDRLRVTPLGVWAMIAAGDDLEAVRAEITEELRADFDAIRTALYAERDIQIEWVADHAKDYDHLSDRELGMIRHTVDPELEPFLFGYRKQSRKFLSMVWAEIRPTGNRLLGYTPSNEIWEDAA